MCGVHIYTKPERPFRCRERNGCDSPKKTRFFGGSFLCSKLNGAYFRIFTFSDAEIPLRAKSKNMSDAVKKLREAFKNIPGGVKNIRTTCKNIRTTFKNISDAQGSSFFARAARAQRAQRYIICA